MHERRLIRLEGCLNFRDLGGYPTREGRRVRWGRLFRSDALHRLTPGDVARLRDELRLGAVVDLRSRGELSLEGRGPLEHEPIRFHHIPLFDDGAATDDAAPTGSLAERYLGMLELAREAVVRVLETLARTPSPAVFHCAAGKDRTGVISALVLGLVGVEEDVIVADYALSQRNLERIIERLRELEGYQAMLELLPPETLHANPETMAELLERLRERHGSVREYLAWAGLSETDARSLVDRLLEDSSPQEEST